MRTYYATIEIYTEQNVPEQQVIQVIGVEIAADGILSALTAASAFVLGYNLSSTTLSDRSSKPELARVVAIDQRKRRGVQYKSLTQVWEEKK